MNIQTTGSKSNPPMVFIHGWPDSADLWFHQVSHFSQNYFCVCITLPQYGDDKSSGWGLDFPELANTIVAEVKNLLGDPNRKVILIGHDWGAFIAYRIEHDYPEWIDKFVTMDVGGHLKPTNLGHKLFLVSYQWYLVFAFLLGKLIPFIGNALSQQLACAAKAPEANKATSEMNYLYLYFWRAVLFRQYRNRLLTSYKPKRPLLYLYGVQKKYAFHSPKWESLLEKLPKCSVVAMEKSDHWLMVREPEQTNKVIEDWLADGSYKGLV